MEDLLLVLVTVFCGLAGIFMMRKATRGDISNMKERENLVIEAKNVEVNVSVAREAYEEKQRISDETAKEDSKRRPDLNLVAEELGRLRERQVH